MFTVDLRNRLPPEDASVISRQKLKAASTRIVELNTKKEDWLKLYVYIMFV